MRCPACSARFRRVEQDFLGIAIAIVCAVLAAVLLSVYKLTAYSWLVLAVGAVVCAYLFRKIGFEVITSPDGAKSRAVTWPPPGWRLMVVLMCVFAPFFVAALVDSALRKSGMPPGPWLMVGFVATLTLFALCGLAEIAIGARAFSRRTWPLIDPEKYPLRPRREVRGRWAMWIGAAYVLAGLFSVVVSAGSIAWLTSAYRARSGT